MLALLLALQAAAAPASLPVDANTVIVKAPSQAIRSAWQRCVAGGCTPRQDVVASIRQAEVEFRAGHYLDSRHVLQDAIGRTKGAAAAEPVAVAALYEATATVSLHEGDQDLATHASGDRLGVLRAAFGERDPRYLQAWLDDINMHVGLLPNGEGISRYAKLETAARAAGQPAIAAAAALRRAAWQHWEGDDYDAKRRLEALRSRSGGDADTNFAVDAMLARFASDHGDLTAGDRLPPRVGPRTADGKTDAAQPVLVFQPHMPSPDDPNGGNPMLGQTGGETTGVAAIRWADIAFQIEPDGRVTEPSIVRGGGGTGWARPILAAIGKRRYTATDLPPEQRRRIERWTLTSDYGVPQGSFVRRRVFRPHFVELDVTSTDPTRIVPASRAK